MLKSRVILTGLAVAAAAVAGSAFTAANDFTAVADDAVGFGSTTVSGATVTASNYEVTTGDSSTLDSITYTHTGDDLVPTHNEAHLYLKGATPSDWACTIGAHGAPAVGKQLIVCDFGVTPVAINSFDTVELTIMPTVAP
jgi:hypothetical protein